MSLALRPLRPSIVRLLAMVASIALRLLAPIALVACDQAATGSAASSGSPGGNDPPTDPPSGSPIDPPSQAPTVPEIRPVMTGRLAILSVESGTPPASPASHLHAAVVAADPDIDLMRVVSLMAAPGDRCRPSTPQAASLAPLRTASFGDTLVIDTPGGTWATLERYEGDGFTGYAASQPVPDGPLPARASMSLSGDPRSGALQRPLPEAAEAPVATVAALQASPQPDPPRQAPQQTPPPAPTPVPTPVPTPDAGTVVVWEPGPAALGSPSSPERIVIELTSGESDWYCEVDDDGELVLDSNVLPLDEPTAGPRLLRIGRLARSVQALDDDVLLVRRLSWGTVLR